MSRLRTKFSRNTTTSSSPTSTKIITIADLNNLKKDKTILIAGFPGPGLVGSISTSYIIDKLEMYQIAFVESHYISPGVIFIDGKLRHPFRLYANKQGNVCVLVCEAPIMLDGTHFVLDAVMDWAIKNSIEEVMVLDGIPVQGIPDSDRKPVILASENMEKNNRKEIIVSDQQKENDEMQSSDKETNSQSNFNRSAIEDSSKKYTTFIGGIAGGLLSACLSNQIPCAAILIPSSSGIPDPEGASLLIETFNNFISDDDLKIETTQLKEQGQKLKRQLEQIIKAEQEQRTAGSGGQEEGNISNHRFMYG
ncbi:proteasome assembly chaperone family protein [Candidatus Nitrosocosmicus franklandus]|uniref:PAC2 family protein n=1 Tax=Candidatus Nitrosocosmicus franklandianus TaxID=1798806 RepID=A0A484IAW3_9ARCH|nr:PAC2 family protein [Candidatus Nitrosocosmicus franklandus]VFJ14278.1 PAC2 family protein [Candidatus Nitrosocosmicus franklandus]